MPKNLSNHPFNFREDRRMQAWILLQQGLTQTEIAKALGVSQGAVSRWLKQAREGGGVEALRRRSAPGKQPLLTKEQFAHIPAVIGRGAESFGFKGNHWTTKRVAAALKQVFGISYHPGHVSRVLKKYCPDWRTFFNNSETR